MTEYNFDKIIDRYNTNCLKYDFAVQMGYPKDVLPLWVADMDFQTPTPVISALKKAVEHGIFGYSDTNDDYYNAVSAWFKRYFNWDTDQKWLVKTPGVVFALSTAVRAFTNLGDSVMIQTPVYYPFYSIIKDNGRKLVENPLLYTNGKYAIDFTDFEEKIKSENVKLFILCSPHNPVGRVWTLSELRKIGDICRKYGVIIASDEIHCDFAFPDHPHTIFANACPDLLDQLLICTAPSKTFNLAGLQTSNIWIPNPKLRNSFTQEIDRLGASLPNCLGIVAAQAAYESGAEWLSECKAYLRNNLDFLRDYIDKNLPEIRLVEPEGTYFAWLDCSGLGLNSYELKNFIVNKAHLWLDDGYIFGKSALLFQRIVLACPRATLKKALDQLEKAIHD